MSTPGIETTFRIDECIMDILFWSSNLKISFEKSLFSNGRIFMSTLSKLVVSNISHLS